LFKNNSLNKPASSLHLHYKGFNTTTGWSAPVTDIGTFFLTGSLLEIFPWHSAPGSQVPCKSLYAARAISIPDAA